MATGALTDVRQVRHCAACGEIECRLERTISVDGRELVGWTCCQCGGLAHRKRGGLWVGHGVLAELGIDRSTLPVRADHRVGCDPAPLPGLDGAEWRAKAVTPAWWPSGR